MFKFKALKEKRREKMLHTHTKRRTKRTGKAAKVYLQLQSNGLIEFLAKLFIHPHLQLSKAQGSEWRTYIQINHCVSI